MEGHVKVCGIKSEVLERFGGLCFYAKMTQFSIVWRINWKESDGMQENPKYVIAHLHNS